MKQFYFLSGIPRSGSTVFSTLISQNPDIYTTPTSPLLDLLLVTKPNWKQVSAFQKITHPDQYFNIERGIITGCYQHITQPIVLEKHRSWVKYVNYIQNTFQIEPKIICTTRRIAEVLASFITLIDKSKKITYIDRELIQQNKPINHTTRCRLLWEQYISVPWKSFKIGYETHRDNLLLIDYQEIVDQPEETLQKVYDFWGMEFYSGHHFDNLSNPQPENDDVYGIVGLHNVKKNLKRTSLPPEQILGQELCDYYDAMNLEFWNH